MRDNPRVRGSGLLARAITDALAGGVGRPLSAVVVVSDAWDTPSLPSVRSECASRSIPWLPVRTELGKVIVGPIELPGVPGCVDCVDWRRGLARRYPDGYTAMWQRHGPSLRERSSALLTGLAAEVVAALVVDDMNRLADTGLPMRTRQALLYVDLRTLRVSRHAFLPDPHCPVCGDRPVDTAAAAQLDLRSRVKPAADVYRARSLASEFADLQRTFVDAECGLVRAVHKDSQSGVIIAAAPLGLPGRRVEYGFGRTRSYRTSELIAILEALERYGGMRPGGRRTAVRASYHEIRDRALDPLSLGVHAPEAYRQDGFPYTPFDPDRPRRWVWGYSFGRKEPILVPESYAYYGLPREDDEPPPFLHETSNGCALGGCLEEAVLHGILEVAERDAFLMTWYARMGVPRIDIGSARNRAVPLTIASIEAENGYRISLFDTTLEQGIPCVWAMAVDPSGDETRPRLMCTGGSHPDPERAAENALHELGPLLTSLMRTYPEERHRAARMADNPFLVRQMADHSLASAHPAVFDRFAFLTGTDQTRSFTEMSAAAGFGATDLRDDVTEMAGRYLDCGLDVVVVDQTTPEHRVGGFACVKAIVPGTLPITFGHDRRRINGLPRLYEVPRQLGYRDKPLQSADVNPHPHPFP